MLNPINQLPQASASQKEPFDLNQQMFYEGMGEDFDAGDQLFPNEVICRILSFLSPKQLLVAGGVSKLWHQLASRDFMWRSFRLKELFPNEPIINRKVWDTYVNLEQHGLVFEKKGRPCVENKRHYFELLRMSSEVEDGQGISILTLPKGLSLSKIIAFAADPKAGNPTQVRVSEQKIIEEQGDVELKETVTVAITNGVFKNSRNEKVAEQIKLVKGLKCEMPQVVVVMALAILRFISSDLNDPLRLFGDDPVTYTRCVDAVEGDHLVVGGFAPGGPLLYHYIANYRYLGVGGQRQFAAIDPEHLGIG